MLEEAPLVFEGLGRDEPGLALGPLFHAHGGPLQRLVVQILQTAEGAARQEVRLDRQKAAFFARFAIGMSAGMTDEAKAVAFGEGFHLRHDHRWAPRPRSRARLVLSIMQTGRRVTPMQQRPMQEALHLEAIKDAIKLQIPALGVAQIKQAGLELGRRSPGQS